MLLEFNSTPSPEARDRFYTLSACSETAVPQTCLKCGAGFTARGTLFIYQPNEAGQFTGHQQFSELIIAVNFCENCR
jgi:hypothetical protein